MKVMDRDVGSSDDFLGDLSLPVSQVAAAEGGELTGDFTLKNAKTGTLQLSCQWKPFC